jgi:hypothetical protein
MPRLQSKKHRVRVRLERPCVLVALTTHGLGAQRELEILALRQERRHRGKGSQDSRVDLQAGIEEVVGRRPPEEEEEIRALLARS